MSKKLSSLLGNLIKINEKDDRQISGICLDSRNLKQGNLFCAYKGYHADGNDFIKEAINKNVSAILTDNKDFSDQSLEKDIPIIFIDNLKNKLSEIAANFYDHPSKKLKIIAVTGTNGKTSFCHFLAQALTELGEITGIIGTVGNGIYGKHSQASLTTPNPFELQELINNMHHAGAKYVVMEASSHGIDQGRINSLYIDTAVFTNLSRDHLDFHGDMMAYGNAKRKLFQTKELKHAIFNLDDEFGKQLTEEFHSKVDTYLFSVNDAQCELSSSLTTPVVRAQHVHMSIKGITASIHSPWGNGLLHINLLGLFNLSNILAVVAVLGIYGFRFEDIIACMAKLKGVIGRMQLFGGENKPYVIVDFAHTPDALKQVLQTLRYYTEGELWCVFGCGGNRDQGKRGLMGQIAETFADKIILTDDNPRDEEPSLIIADILQSILEPERVVIEHDRRRAIAHAINCAKIGDIILIAGKGHENYQIYGNTRSPFSDEIEVQMFLAER